MRYGFMLTDMRSYEAHFSQDRNVLFLLVAMLSVKGHHLRPQRRQTLPVLQVKMS